MWISTAIVMALLSSVPGTNQQNNKTLKSIQGSRSLHTDKLTVAKGKKQSFQKRYGNTEIISEYTNYTNVSSRRHEKHRVKRNLLSRFIAKLRRKNPQHLRSGAKVVRSDEGLWQFPPKYGTLPDGAFHAGLDDAGTPVYIGRGFIPGEDGSMVPGRITANDVCVEVSWQGWGRCVFKYQVLVGYKFKWMPGHRDRFPYKNVGGGIQHNIEEGKSKLFVCRYYIRNENLTDQMVVGKVTEDGRCAFGFNGIQTILYNVYEILTHK